MSVERKPDDPPHWSGKWAKVDERGYYEGRWSPNALMLMAAIFSAAVLVAALMFALNHY